MSFVVSARKYRPQNFDEVIGQDHIAQTLKNALKNDKLAHAFLFAGPRGVGKTTSARILAKVLNCENLQEGYKACGECSSCKAFLDNASFNIFELDAASNNSVEHIRSLNEQVRFQPQQGAFKIYIIDEVHMLSQAAFNAFLKTLEEPPPYAKFILATTEKHKIIPTILSRCQIFDFRRIQIKDIVGQLADIAKKENRTIDEEALHLIAQKADGAMRDALSIYDKVVSSVEGEINYADVAENLNVLDYDYYFRIVDAMLKEDFSTLMLIYDDISKKGFEAEQFCIGIMEHLRQLMLVKDLQTAAILEIGEQLKKRYEDQAKLCSQGFLLSAISVFNQTDINLPRSQNKRLSIEIALSKVAFMNRLVDKKKTTELNSAPTAIKKEKEEQKNPAFDLKEEDENESAKLTTATTEAEPNPPADAVKKMVKKEVVSTAKISSNLDSLLSRIEADETEKAASSKPFTEEFIQSFFESQKEKTNSKSLLTALNYVKINIVDDHVKVLTPTQIYIDFIRQENELIESLHDLYPNRDLKMQFEVSEETFPDYEPPKMPKMLTTKEKYDMLISKNPHFEKMVTEFKLKIINQ